MKKLTMQTPDITAENIAKIVELFPHVATEKEGINGVVEKAVDFELLKQILSKELVDGDDERYYLDWPGKKASLLKANTPITKTLRPDRDGSVNFDTTENVFIEGDNFEVLKLLQESYLGKIKMIYIDPPYNTGSDFVYKDNFSKSKDEYDEEIGLEDEDGGKLFRNTDTNGRFHSDWLSMMYERLLIARDLLRDDGVIFISIDDNEVTNLRKICDEVFGEANFINSLMTRRRIKSLNVQFAENGLRSFNVGFEYILVYSKTSLFVMNALRMNKANIPTKGIWNVFWSGADRPTMRYELLGFTPSTGQWRWSKEKAEEAINNYEVFLKDFSERMSLEEYWVNTGEKLKFIRKIKDGQGKNGGVQYWIGPTDSSLRTSNWTDIEVSEISKEFGLPFDNPKSKKLIETVISTCGEKDFTVLDFFAGSGTTAHAVMSLNAEDGGNRKFVMVQISEETNKDSEACKAGYKYISDISKERIRRAGKKILEENKESLAKRATPLDVGFRVYKADTSNMKDVYYHPSEVEQKDLFNFISNIKEDRTSEDLLIQVILDLGLTLDLPVERKELRGNTVYFVADNALVACFDNNIDVDIVDEIAKHKPHKVVFKDASFKEEQDRTNIDTRMKRLSPETIITVL